MFERVELKFAKSLRFLGWTIILFCVVFFGLAASVYDYFQQTHLGNYWGGVLIAFTGLVAASSRNRCCVVFGIVVSMLAMIVGAVAFTGSLIDAFIFAKMAGCYNTETGQSWGTAQGQKDAMKCANDTSPYLYNANNAQARELEVNLLHYNYYYNNPNSSDNNFFYNHPNWIYYYNENHQVNWYANHNKYYWDYRTYYHYYFIDHQCACADSFICYGYDLTHGSDCGSILTTYTGMVISVSVFLLILLVLTFVYSIHACCSAFRSSESVVPVATIEVTPVQVQMAGAEFAQPGISSLPAVVYGISSVPAAQYVAQYAPVPMSAAGDVVALGNEKYV